jgi:hypothetical protein
MLHLRLKQQVIAVPTPGINFLPPLLFSSLRLQPLIALDRLIALDF